MAELLQDVEPPEPEQLVSVNDPSEELLQLVLRSADDEQVLS